MKFALLDTSALIGHPDLKLSVPTGISVLSVAELQHGILIANDAQVRAQRLTRLTQLLSIYQPLPVDEPVAASYGELAAATSRAGLKARTRHMDLLIAATAHAHHASLVTSNGADVRHLKEFLDIIEI